MLQCPHVVNLAAAAVWEEPGGNRMQRAWVLVVILVVILAFALATGHPMFWRSVYVFGLLLVISLVWVWTLIKGIDVEVRRPTNRSRAGGEIKETVAVRRRNQLLRGYLEIRERTNMPVATPGAVLSMGDSESVNAELVVPCPIRGLFDLGPASITGSDPFGLFRLNRLVGHSQKLIVHPSTIELPGFILLPADLPGEGPRHLRSQHVTTSAYGVRDYAVGDSLNRISWKSSAHHDRLMVKEFEIEPANNIWVLADMERRAHTPPGERSTEESVVTLTASICKRYLDANYPVGFMSYGSETVALSAQRGSGQLLRIFDSLAELKAQGARPLLDLTADLHLKSGRYTSVAIVTASPSTDWLDGVRHLLERKSRITVVIVDPDPTTEEHPHAALEAAALGVPTYVVKRGRERETGLTALTPTAVSWEPRFQKVMAGR